MSPRSHGLAVLHIPRGDGTNRESRRATVTQIRAADVATLRPFGRSQSWRATAMQIRALEVATPLRATVTRIRALKVATQRPFCRSQSWRATVTQIRAVEIATLRPFGRSHSLSGRLYVQTPDRPPQRLCPQRKRARSQGVCGSRDHQGRGSRLGVGSNPWWQVRQGNLADYDWRSTPAPPAYRAIPLGWAREVNTIIRVMIAD